MNASLDKAIDLNKHLDHQAAQAIELVEDEGVALPQSVQATRKFWPIAICRSSGDLVAVDPIAASIAERLLPPFAVLLGG